jgi:hypothetical protein
MVRRLVFYSRSNGASNPIFCRVCYDPGIERQVNRLSIFATALAVVLSTTTADAFTASCPATGTPRFELGVPEGWRSRIIGGTEHRIELVSPRDGAKIQAWTLPIADAARLDDVVARSVDATLTKAEFSNLHQRRQLNGVPVIAFIGSGRDRKQAHVVRFEFYAFTLDDHEIGMLRIDVPAVAGSTTHQAASAAAASLKIVER